MTYNEWRDELKSNLLSVSETEKKRVLDYYAEAYADRREAGFSEREIIDGFGAPFDAAQRILNEEKDEQVSNIAPEEKNSNTSAKKEKTVKPKKERGLGFVLICLLLSLPLLVVFIVLASVAIAFCCIPISAIGGGIASIVASVFTITGGDVAHGFYELGGGVISIGVGIILLPILFKIAALTCKLTKKLFFSFKERV